MASRMTGHVSGMPERTRTSDLMVRNHTLYPAELRAHSAARSHRDSIVHWPEA